MDRLFKKIGCVVTLLILAVVFTANAQKPTDSTSIKKLLDKAEARQKAYTSEKLYLHFDKPYYAAGDTIWFKIYLLNAATRGASAYSNKVYVELLNDSSKLIQTLVIPMASGLGQGDIKLDGNFRGGMYTIRAYTNWMQNFGEELFFHQRFYIGKPANNSWLVGEQHTTTASAAGKQIKLALQLKNMQGQPVVDQALTVHLLEGRRGILKNDVQTAIDGSLNTGFTLPAKADAHKLNLLIEDKADKTKKIIFPFYPNSADDVDLQFMPEGGSLVAGLYNKVGFKAIGEDGLGIAIEGSIINEKTGEAFNFKSLHNGMGSFAIVPNAGDTYTAKIKLPGGQEKTYKLPAAKPTGIVLRADAVTDPDSIRLYITGTADKQNGSYTLLAQGMDVPYLGMSFKLVGGFFNTRIAKNMFPTGIVNFSITGKDGTPINARKVFVDRHDRLNVAVNTDKPMYAANDSIAINFVVTDKNINPIQANFSVTVTDDGQVKNELRQQSINSYFLLSSELKGNLEGADWYFDIKNPSSAKALDNLMLTQGWIGYTDIKTVEKGVPQPLFLAEADNSISGKLTNFFNKPATNRHVTIMSHWHEMMVMDTVTDAEGKFKFENLPFSDSTAYTIKVHNSKGKEAAVGFQVNEFKPAPLPVPDTSRLMPWYANTDTTLLNYLKVVQEHIARKDAATNGNGRVLKEVNIKSRKKASLQGADGDDVYFADADIDEKQLSKHGNISLLAYLEKYVNGFYTKMSGTFEFYAMKGNWVRDFIIDSMSVMHYYMGGTSYYEHAKSVLENTPAAGVKNVVIYHVISPGGKSWLTYVIIKTRNNTGPVFKTTPGSYVYRPLPLYLPREFYRPKYNVKNQNTLADLRSTIHWEPNLVTDENGNAKLSFYAAAQPGTYTVVIEGTDMQGHFGVSTTQIKIAGKYGLSN